jgi:hypothetical protein
VIEELEVCEACQNGEPHRITSSAGMGTVLGDNIKRVFQRRQGRRIFTGMIDLDLRLYAWAPGDGQTIKNFTWEGYMSFGEEEWATLLEYRVKRLEFKDPKNGLIYQRSMKQAKRFSRLDDTTYGPRVLVPLRAFRVVNVHGVTVKPPHGAYV